jgi:SnoaL-like polyketide cyclase
MSQDWLDRYLDAWVFHCLAGGPDGQEAAERFLTFMGDDVLYEDVPSGAIFEGHPGIVEMFSQSHQMSADLMYEIVSRQTDGRMYAFESFGKGTNTGAVGPIPSTGRPFELRVLSVGEFSNGVVHAHRDYWDLVGLLTQLGVMPTTPRA